eukprot:gene10951-7601_t
MSDAESGKNNEIHNRFTATNGENQKQKHNNKLNEMGEVSRERVFHRGSNVVSDRTGAGQGNLFYDEKKSKLRDRNIFMTNHGKTNKEQQQNNNNNNLNYTA